ncbi:recombinase family protein [Shewanella sp. GXUN23E]|uniref:recombinase family protein n=1 Tax=Shewanella sp. GXUN23E TaxID=3422498 RepID=UPI003D7D2B01
MQYIYGRVSTQDQNVDQQVALLQGQAGWQDAVIFKEKASGKSVAGREQFAKLRDTVKTGDSVLVQSVSRLGRCTSDVSEFVQEMRELGVSVFVYDLGMLDVCSPNGKMLLVILASVAEMQREEILEKQKVGIKRAQAEGKFKGKQQSPKTVQACQKALEYVEKGLTKEAAAKAVGIGVTTLYRFIGGYK